MLSGRSYQIKKISFDTTMADAKQGKTPIEDFYNGTQSRVVLAKPRLGGFGSTSFASGSNKGCNPFGSVLRPSQLKPGSNPFLKLNDTSDSASADKERKEQEKESESPEDRLNENKEEEEAPKFVPLGSSNATPRPTNQVPAPPQPTSSSSSSGFVFGQNLSERVVIKESVNNGDATVSDHSSTNGTSELLFTSAAQATVKENNQDEAGPSKPTSSGGAASGGSLAASGGSLAVSGGSLAASGGEGLAAAAAEYERSHARPPPPTTNSYITGEEGEINVLQISCRLFAWEAGSWRERGRGVLRLNDGGGAAGGGATGPAAGSRLVVRAAGSLRVLLNTALWRGMVSQRAGARALRITAATDHTNVKLFLIMGVPGDINQLYRALTSRIAVSKDCAQNNTSQQAAERLEAATNDSDFNDKPADDNSSDNDDSAQEIHRLEQKTDDLEADNTEQTDDDDKTKPLKRKEPVENDTPPKRQCPDVLTD